MADWEDEDFEPVAPVLKLEPPKGMWDDEDADDNNVKESWEDDEDTTEPPKPEPQVEKAVVTKPSAKAAGKKSKQPETKTSEVADEILADPVAEKFRQQRLVEEADYRSTAELFGKKPDEKSLENFIPKSENDFMQYAELLSHKIRPYEKSFHYIGLLKAVMRLSMAPLKAADAKEIASSVSAIANEKLKTEKEANAGKKKQGAKKKQLHVEKAEDDVVVSGAYDVGDDFDFM